MPAVNFTPAAKAQLRSLFRYIAEHNHRDIAARYARDIVAHCQTLSAFPHRGTPRDDIRPGLRTLAFRRRVTILYVVEDDCVSILGIFYGGQDYQVTFSGGEP